MIKEKNWWVWEILGVIAWVLVLIFSDITIKLTFLIIEIVCYVIGLYKLFKGV